MAFCKTAENLGGEAYASVPKRDNFALAGSVCMVLMVFFLVGERKDAELTPVLSIPMNQPQARTWTIVSGAEALAAFAGEFQEMTG